MSRRRLYHVPIRPALRPARSSRPHGAASRRHVPDSICEEVSMAATETAYRVLSLPEQAHEGDDDRVFIRLRRTLDIGAFGASAVYQAKAGEEVIGEHDELGPGADRQEELYVVVQGDATFTLDGEEREAPHGTVVFVQPGTTRKAV